MIARDAEAHMPVKRVGLDGSEGLHQIGGLVVILLDCAAGRKLGNRVPVGTTEQVGKADTDPFPDRSDAMIGIREERAPRNFDWTARVAIRALPARVARQILIERNLALVEVPAKRGFDGGVGHSHL